jgi:hypothetical protein
LAGWHRPARSAADWTDLAKAPESCSISLMPFGDSEHALPEQVELRPAIHLPLQDLELVDLALHPAV